MQHGEDSNQLQLRKVLPSKPKKSRAQKKKQQLGFSGLKQATKRGGPNGIKKVKKEGGFMGIAQSYGNDIGANLQKSESDA